VSTIIKLDFSDISSKRQNPSNSQLGFAVVDATKASQGLSADNREAFWSKRCCGVGRTCSLLSMVYG